jgi:chaperonin GroES
MTEKRVIDVQMLGNYIMMRRDLPEEQKSPGGIVIPKTVQSNTVLCWGEAIGVGPEAAVAVKVGDQLLVGKYAGTEVTVGEEQVVVVRLEDVFGVHKVG